MSHVTNVILTMSLCEDGDSLRNFTERLGDMEAPARVDQHASGDKVMQNAVYVGAYNFLLLDELAMKIEETPWEYPEIVRLFIEGEEDEDGVHEVLLNLPGERRKKTPKEAVSDRECELQDEIRRRQSALNEAKRRLKEISSSGWTATQCETAARLAADTIDAILISKF